MTLNTLAAAAAALVVSLGLRTGGPAHTATQPARSSALATWKQGGSAFGIFVPSERPMNATDANGNRLPPLYTEGGAHTLGSNPLLDYLFLNLEGAYDAASVKAMVTGLSHLPANARPTLLVRIPTIEAAGADSTRARVKAVLAMGADGVVIPHVRNAAEARTAVQFFKDAGANVWTRANPKGTVVAMLMIEDTGAVAELNEIAAVPGYSLLSCGIGSLTQNMGGREKAAEAEAACQRVRDVADKAGMPSMMTANGATLRDRITRGYKGLLLTGAGAPTDSLIRIGREAVGRK
jgi:2-keto-3-deoxy-L-rhamnonate aldolase RhmA